MEEELDENYNPPEDEIEEYLTQDIIDVRNDFKFNKIENEVKRKFILHKHIQ